MSVEILINVTPRETRIALVENSILQDIYIERANNLRLVGNIYKGKVVRVLPGMQAAFIDIGLDRTAFLHENDLTAQQQQATINGSLRVGQELLVQVVKDPINEKGARLTTQISIATRTLAYIPELDHSSVSTKISDPIERERLQSLLKNSDNDDKGFIVRTMAEGSESLSAEQQYLRKTWDKIAQQSKNAKTGDVVFHELSLTLRSLRDLIGPTTNKIIIDDIDQFADAQRFLTDFVPGFKGTIELYNNTRPLFDLYSINDEINRALMRKVPLKSGGYLVIDHTEAMTTIDVNTGAYVGSKSLEETVYRTNLEAVSVICRQLRLRNLGGMIIVDFIDMHTDEHKEAILRALERELQLDQVKTTFHGFTALGLIEITRKRTRESLQHALCIQCATCQGRGFTKSMSTVIDDIFREVQRSISMHSQGNILINASPMIIEHLRMEMLDYIAELEDAHNKIIKMQPEVSYTPEQFDVVLL